MKHGFLSLLLCASSFALSPQFIEGGSIEIGREIPLLPLLRNADTVLIPSYRIQSFGDAEFRFVVKSKHTNLPLTVTVEGPLENFGDTVPPGTGPVLFTKSKKGAELQLQVLLKTPGIYRLLISNSNESVGVETTGMIRTECIKNCYRPTIPQGEFVEGLKKSGVLVPILEKVRMRVAPYLSDSLSKGLFAGIENRIMKNDFSKTEMFPVLPSAHQLGEWQEVLAEYDANPLKKPEVTGGELFELLGECKTDRKALPPSIDKDFPSIRYGHFTSQTLSNCTISHSQKFSEILTALAAGNGSVVTAFGETVRSPEALLKALIQNGYHVEMNNIVTYANFIALTADDKTYVQWPAWINVPVAISGAKNFNIPMSHTHYDWRVYGPNLNVRVSFFLGIHGVGFWAETDERPAWTGGYVSRSRYTVGENKTEILGAVKLASIYLKRILEERQRMVGDGYGVLGICQDSQGVIEKKLFNTVSNYPLMRSNKVDASSPVFDELSETLKLLPRDSSATKQLLSTPDYQQDVLCRVLKSTPHPVGSPLIPGEALRKQLRSIRCKN